jgi:hypothetical protein
MTWRRGVPQPAGLRYDGLRAFTGLLDAGGGSTAGRARALQALALLHVYYPTPQSRAAARESLALFEHLGDLRNVAISKLVIAWEAQYHGDADAALAMVADSRQRLGDADNGWWQAMTYYVEASLHLRLGAFDISARQWRHSLELIRPTGDPIVPGGILAHLGVALREAGRTAEALSVLGKVIDGARAVGSLHSHAFALVQLAHARLDLGDGDGVTPLLREADEVARRVRNPAARRGPPGVRPGSRMATAMWPLRRRSAAPLWTCCRTGSSRGPGPGCGR